VTIEVVALDWKWLFIYPEQGIATVNKIVFPAHTPVNFKITSDAVMNSFFIPGLGGQIYAMAGMQTKLHLIANRTLKWTVSPPTTAVLVSPA
jgi:cytochrome o ubiquinol oxidase subunit 2